MAREPDKSNLLFIIYQIRVQFVNVNVGVKKSRRQDATLWSALVLLTYSSGNAEPILTL